MILSTQAADLARKIIAHAKDEAITITTAESCTGGLIGAALTEISGSSAVFDRGFITYSNQAKMDMLGVRKDTLNAHGAVSAQTAQQMALGALKQSQAMLSVSVTGIAGPKSDDSEKPVGLVYIATAFGNKVIVEENQFGDLGRQGVREATTIKALAMLLDAIQTA